MFQSSSISALATMFRLCLGLGLSMSLQGHPCLSAQCQADFPCFQWTSQAWIGGKSGCLGPLFEFDEFDEDPPPPPRPRPRPLLLPLPRPPLLETAATSAVPDVAWVRAATAVVLAALEFQTLSALSNTAVYVALSNSMSAMDTRTICGRDLLHIPSTVFEQ